MFWFFLLVSLSLREYTLIKKGEEKSKFLFVTLLAFLNLDYYQLIKH